MSAALRLPAAFLLNPLAVVWSRLRQRPQLSSQTLVLCTALLLTTIHNLKFWHVALPLLPKQAGSHTYATGIALFITLVSLLTLLILVFSNRWLLKPALVILLMIAAICSYFMNAYGTVIDAEMLVNVLQTDRREAGELIGLPLLAHVLLLGILPSIYVLRARITRVGVGREILRNLLLAFAALGLTATAVFSHYKELSMWTRENRQVRLYVNPTYPLYSVIRYTKALYAAPRGMLMPIATDAVRPVDASSKPLNVILVVGETARAANFGLNGYERDTTPGLRQIPGLINFSDVSSCGTFTAESLPCMFSRLGKRNFSRSDAESQQNLLDVLQRVGVSVLWRENNSGCKGVCARVPSEEFKDAATGQNCTAVGCPDEILLNNLGKQFSHQNGQAKLIVLHQLGSHGPSYYRRYPPEFRRFTPDCAIDEVQSCSHEEIVNAYDNTLLYTDDLLSRAIALLRSQEDQADSVLIYVSDHGESLGEHGLYLHGLPYAIAPEVQTHIPMVAWLSDGAKARLKIPAACLQAQRTESVSHDNLFDTVLGLFSIRTADYKPAQDLFRHCE